MQELLVEMCLQTQHPPLLSLYTSGNAPQHLSTDSIARHGLLNIIDVYNKNQQHEYEKTILA